MSELTILADVISRCPDCDLAATRTLAVPGEGPEHAEIMFIGEGPGFNEDRSGRPFVGAAGKFLDRLLALADLDRSRVFITNVVKCRPPNNRDPQPGEIAACSKYLERQLAIIQPKVVVTLGRHSMSRWFPGASISRIHGRPKVFGDLLVVPMFHPAAALHQERYRTLIEDDFRRLPEFLATAHGRSPEPEEAGTRETPPASDPSARTPSPLPPDTVTLNDITEIPVIPQDVRQMPLF